MGVWVTWLMFRTSGRARLIIAKIKPLLYRRKHYYFCLPISSNFNERVHIIYLTGRGRGRGKHKN